MTISDTSAVTPRDRRRAAAADKAARAAAASPKTLTAPPQGTPFDLDNRLFSIYDSGTVFEYGEFDAADITTMLRSDGKARSTEQVLTLPLRSANWKIHDAKVDRGQTALVRDNLADKMATLIDQCTTAIGYRKAFFETTWKLAQGKIVYDRIDWRPPGMCEAGFDPRTGNPKGFRQRVVPVGGLFPTTGYESVMPGYVIIAPARAFIYTHGAYREPIRGVSDLDVAFWCFETKRKVQFLWFQYLENQAIPKTIVYGDDETQAADLAEDVAELRGSGVLGLPRSGDPAAKAFEILESSGRGAAEFFQAIKYLDTQMVASVLAGFTELADNSTASRRGSYALSADQSEFFLASRQAVADEIAAAITEQIIRPLVVHNYGPDAEVPRLEIGPLSKESTARALTLLQAVIAAPNTNVPREFIDQLTVSVAGYLGLDETKVSTAVAKAAEDAKKLAAAQAKAAARLPVPAPAAHGKTLPVPGTGAGAASGATPTDAKAPAHAAAAPPPPKVSPVKQSKVLANPGDAAAVELARTLITHAASGGDAAALLAELTEEN